MSKNEDLKQWLYKYKLFIIAFLIVTLTAIAFLAGAKFACAGGVSKNFKCITPVKVATVGVCEYNSINCHETCKEFIVNDVGDFCIEYAKTNTWQP